jgi:hypothetical protein
MMAEQVILDARPLKVSDRNSVQVSAIFTMCNQGQADERMQVRFPLVSQMGDGWGKFPQVQNLSVRVNNKLVATTVISAPFDTETLLLPWAAFEVTFPISKNVIIRVAYTLQPTEWGSEARLDYILAAGAGWYGPIGVADVILRLPYTATIQNVTEIRQGTTEGELIENEARLHSENLEPTEVLSGRLCGKRC